MSALAAQRAALFASTCRVERKMQTQDALGQTVDAWEALATVPCGVKVEAASTRPLSAMAQQVDARIHLPLSLPVQPRAGDRIVVVQAYGRPAQDQVFEIVHALPQFLSLRCDCRRLEVKA